MAGGPSTPRDLRARLWSLNGLPLRPGTLRAWIVDAGASDGEPARDSGEPANLDPGWAFHRAAMGLRTYEAPPAGSTWWEEPASDAAREAIERLWRRGVSVACAVEKLGSSLEPERRERLVLLGCWVELGAWALAAVAPGRLAEWMSIGDAVRRMEWEREWLGTDLVRAGVKLARRAGCGSRVLDLLSCASAAGRGRRDDEDAERAVLATAVEAMERTPWGMGGERYAPVNEDLRRWLTSTVQATTVGGFFEAKPSAVELAAWRAIVDAQAQRDEERARGERIAKWIAAFRTSVRRRSLGASGRKDEVEALWCELGAWCEEFDRLERESDGFRLAAMGRGEEPDDRLLDALGEFAAGAGHELNNPLAVVMGRAQLLLHKTSDPDVTRSLRAIIEQAQRATAMIRDLMYVARPPEAAATPCVPEQVLKDVVEAKREEARRRGIEVELKATKGEPVDGDVAGMKHAAGVLIANAIEASETGGIVEVEARRMGDWIVWTVSDCGAGWSEEARRHAMTPFYCGRQAGRGLGMGLPRVRRYLDRVGGRLEWETIPGGGTTARLLIPSRVAIGQAVPPRRGRTSA